MDDSNSDAPAVNAQKSNPTTLTEKTQSGLKEDFNLTDEQKKSQNTENEDSKEINAHGEEKEDLSSLGNERAQSREKGELESAEQKLGCGVNDLNLLERQNKDAGERLESGASAAEGAADSSEGEAEEGLERDETEGIKKALKKSYKAAKQFFKGSEEKGKGDNLQHSRQHPVPGRHDEDEYDFTHHKRGRAVIINNEIFRPGSNFDSRPGSDKDAEALKEVFKKLGFDVKLHHNLTALEMKQELEKEARLYDHRSADCLAVVILSHGDSHLQEKSGDYYYLKAHPLADMVRRDLIFGVDGLYISTASVMRTFQDDRCPGLVGKPRLFFLQACRGADYDDGVDVAVVPDASKKEDDDEDERFEDAEDAHSRRRTFPHVRRYITCPAPIFKDYLVMYATTPGHFAWRRPSGTWFVQSLHTVFTKHLTPHMSLTQALTRVARMVALGYQSNSNTPSMSGKKQTPVIESMLVKDIYFAKK